MNGMNYIVIDKFPEPTICRGEDGEILYWDDPLDATKWMLDNCQNGLIVKIAP